MFWLRRLKMETDWEPDEEQLEWTRQFVNMLKNNGVWAIPASGTIVTFDKRNMRAYISGNQDHELALRTKKALMLIGYTIIERKAA